jgi:hypothetical protein
MKHILFVLSFLLVCIVKGQDLAKTPICDIEVKVDSYTGEKKIQSPFTYFSGGVYKLEKIKEVPYLWIKLESSVVLTIPEGEKLYIKFSDSTVINFPILKTSFSDYQSSSKNFTNSFLFSLTGTNLEQLKTKKIAGFKCYINEYPLYYSYGDIFFDILHCLLKTK